MKKTLIFLHLLLFLSTASAQSSLGLQVGVDYSKVKFFHPRITSQELILEEGFSFPSQLFGILGSHKLSKKLSGEISIYHTIKNDIPKTDFGFDPSFFSFALGYKTLITSVSAKYRLFKNTDVGLGLFSRYIYDAHSIRRDGEKLSATKNVNNLGLLLSLGYNYDSFTFQLNYSIGQKLKFDLFAFSEFFSLVERIQSIDLRIIYKFKL